MFDLATSSTLRLNVLQHAVYPIYSASLPVLRCAMSRSTREALRHESLRFDIDQRFYGDGRPTLIDRRSSAPAAHHEQSRCLRIPMPRYDMVSIALPPLPWLRLPQRTLLDLTLLPLDEQSQCTETTSLLNTLQSLQSIVARSPTHNNVHLASLISQNRTPSAFFAHSKSTNVESFAPWIKATTEARASYSDHHAKRIALAS